MITEIDLGVQDSHGGVSTALTIDGKTYNLYFVSDADALRLSGEGLLTLATLPLMRVKSDVVFSCELDSIYLNNHKTIQDIYVKWDRGLSRINVESGVLGKRCSEEKRTGIFFSGGVDSFYSLLKNKNEITDLIFVHGYDIDNGKKFLRKRVSQMLQAVGREFGKNVIEVETNARMLLDPYVRWADLAHGPALTAVGHMLSGGITKIIIPASYSYETLEPWGTHPLVDRLWSSSALEFVHDGCEKDRVEKVEYITRSQVALKYLRVCWENNDDKYNCCTCEKCLRTMLCLYAFDALDKCATFDNDIDEKLMKNVIGSLSLSEGITYPQLCEFLRKKKPGDGLEKALSRILRRREWKRMRRKMKYMLFPKN